MYANGFFEEKRLSPAGLATVIGLHAAALGAVMLFGTTTFHRVDPPRLKIIDISIPPPPPVIPPPPPRPQQAQQLDTPTVTQPVVQTVTPPIVAQITPPQVYQPPVTPTGPIVLAENTRVEIPPPVRHAAEVDPRFRDALQPPYPRDQETLQRVGQVRVRITIGTDGRVTAIEQLSATNDSFWRVTERQARNRWRFRPATVDGRPIVSTMVFTVTFRIPDA
jgi:protein TonB